MPTGVYVRTKKVSRKTRLRMSLSRIGRKHSEFSKLKMSLNRSGKMKGSENHRFGKCLSKYHIQRIKESNSGERSHFWKGEKAGYGAIHIYVRKHNPAPKKCENCWSESALDLANQTGIYDRNIKNYKYLCRNCHMNSDGRKLILSKLNIGRRPNKKTKLKMSKSQKLSWIKRRKNNAMR